MRPFQHRPFLFVLGCVLGLLALSARAGKTSASFVVIVHPQNRINDIDRSALRDIFLKRTTTWDNGETIRPADLSPQFAARAGFAREVLNKSLAQLRSYWNQQIFSGKSVPPPALDSEAAMIRYILDNPDAVGYLPADANRDGVKVIPVR